MTLQVLVPCLDKTENDILDLCAFLRIQSDVMFLNQNGNDSSYSLLYKGHCVRVVETSWRGVSRARNELIRRCDADIALFIDDDCVLANGYPSEILEAYQSIAEADAIRFNTNREYWNPINARAKKRKKARFRDLSSFGMWGLSFKPEAFRKVRLLFKEYLGAPNYLYNGEDSVFLYDLCKSGLSVYSDPFVICDVQETKASTWFSSYGERYFVTKGFVYSYLYHGLWWLALRRMFRRYGTEYGLSYMEVKQYAAKGRYMLKTHNYDAVSTKNNVV